MIDICRLESLCVHVPQPISWPCRRHDCLRLYHITIAFTHTISRNPWATHEVMLVLKKISDEAIIRGMVSDQRQVRTFLMQSCKFVEFWGLCETNEPFKIFDSFEEFICEKPSLVITQVKRKDVILQGRVGFHRFPLHCYDCSPNQFRNQMAWGF